MKKYFVLAALFLFAVTFYGYAEETALPEQTQNGNGLAPLLQRTLEYAKGHATFRNIFFKEHEKEFVRLIQEGQSPRALFISCSDSRYVPELIANALPGELFVIRTAGNFVSTYNPNIAYDGVAGTIEYAVNVLGVKDIIVCGHSKCGAVKGLFSPEVKSSPKFELLSRWLQFGEDTKAMTNLTVGANVSDEERYAVAERINVLFQLEHLLTYSFVKKMVDEGKIYLHGWHFDIENGEISYWDPEAYKFLSLSSLIDD